MALTFHDFLGLTIKYQDFPLLENKILKFHDFPGFTKTNKNPGMKSSDTLWGVEVGMNYGWVEASGEGGEKGGIGVEVVG